jgi:hypothetical protein
MYPFGFMFQIFPILFLAVFGLAIGIFVSVLAKNGKQNRRDNQSPRLTAEASVVSKRTHVWGDHSHTDYYVTFEFESGDRLELKIPHDRFGYLVEGDKGKLSFQGSRFFGFERT